MPLPIEPKHEFRVLYKAKPMYDGTFNAGLKPGTHGQFDTMADAQAGVAKCKKWFGEEVVIKPKANERGEIVNEKTTTLHDNVMSWIDHYIDGVLQDNAKADKKVA